MITEHVAMVAGEDDQRVVGQSRSLQAFQDPPDLMVNQRNHPVVVRHHLGQLSIALWRHFEALLAKLRQFRICDLRFALKRGPMPPGPTFEVERPMLG